MVRERSGSGVGATVCCRRCAETGRWGSGPLRTCCVASCSKRDLREDTDEREVSSTSSLLAIVPGGREEGETGGPREGRDVRNLQALGVQGQHAKV